MCYDLLNFFNKMTLKCLLFCVIFTASNCFERGSVTDSKITLGLLKNKSVVLFWEPCLFNRALINDTLKVIQAHAVIIHSLSLIIIPSQFVKTIVYCLMFPWRSFVNGLHLYSAF